MEEIFHKVSQNEDLTMKFGNLLVLFLLSLACSNTHVALMYLWENKPEQCSKCLVLLGNAFQEVHVEEYIFP